VADKTHYGLFAPGRYCRFNVIIVLESTEFLGCSRRQCFLVLFQKLSGMRLLFKLAESSSGLLIHNNLGVLGDIKRLLDDPDGLRRDEPKNRLLVGHEAALNIRLFLEANNGIHEF